ncbi:hypothetical protein Tco_1158751, partial [Tanacetum coccineum]
MIAYLQKSEGSAGFHQIIDFLTASHIKYALTKDPKIYVSFIQQFLETTTASTNADGKVEPTATIDGQEKTITEASLRIHLKLKDSDGLTSLPNTEILEQLALMGYVSDSDRLTFQKGYFSPQWSNMKRISKGYSGVDIPLFPTMLTAPESSPSRITSLPSLSPQTHLSTSQPQTTSVTEEAIPMPHESPLQSVHSLGCDEGSVSLNELTDLCTSLSKKVGALENELQQTKKTYSTAITKLILRVKKLEQKVQTTKAKRRARIILSKDEQDVEDSSKQGRKISAIDKDPIISLVQPEQEMEHDVSIAEETTWFQEDAKIQEKNSADTKILLQEEEPTELVEDQGSGEKCEKEVSTVGAKLSTVAPEVSIAAGNLVYIRRSAEKRKDKGKAIMEGDESVQKKTKKQLEQERLGHEEAIRLYHAQLNRPYSVAEDHIQSFAHMDSKKEKGSEKKGSRNKSFAKKRAGEKQSDQSTKRKKMKDDAKKEDFKEYLNIVPEEGMNVEALR